MKTTRTAMTVAVFLILSAVAALSGCASQGDGSTGAGTNTRVLSAQDSNIEQPVQPTDKPVDKNPEVTQVPRPELGVPAAEAKTAPGDAKSPQKGKKVAYLTFDDGPNSDYTERILDILRKKKVKATFMVVGKNINHNPMVLQRILADGHGVANHTYSHDYNKIYRSPEAFVADLDENNKVIAKYTGKPAMLFRAPGGPDKLTQSFKNKLRERGYISVGWNISSVDSDPRGVSQNQVYNNIFAGLERVEHLKLAPIILMHDGTQLVTTEAKPGTALAAYIQNREATIGALPAIIDHFKSKGYTFVVVDEHTPPAW